MHRNLGVALIILNDIYNSIISVCGKELIYERKKGKFETNKCNVLPILV